MDGLVEAGFVVLGGPLADEHRVVLIVDADSKDAVRGTLGSRPVERDGACDRLDRRLDDSARRSAPVDDPLTDIHEVRVILYLDREDAHPPRQIRMSMHGK